MFFLGLGCNRIFISNRNLFVHIVEINEAKRSDQVYFVLNSPFPQIGMFLFFIMEARDMLTLTVRKWPDIKY